MVPKGLWRGYGLNISKKELSFNVYKSASKNAVFKICDNFRLKNNNLKYFISDSQGNMLDMSKNLKKLLNKISWKNFKFIN